MPVFTLSHPFLEEALEYQTLMVGLAATLVTKHAQFAITELVDSIHTLMVRRDLSISGQIEMPKIRPMFKVSAGRRSDIITLYGCDTMFEYMAGNADRPKKVRFSKRKNSLSPNVPRESWRAPRAQHQRTDIVTHESADLMSSLVLVTANLIGGAYESQLSKINSNHGQDYLNWPPELQFFRHMRNGCFHRNVFDIRSSGRGREPINENAPPKWHLYAMPDRVSMNGQKVVGGCFPHNQLLPFLYDMGNII